MLRSPILFATAAIALALLAASATAQDAAAADPAAAPAAADPAAAAAPAAPADSTGFNPRSAMSTMAAYIDQHPDFVKGVIAWMLGGSIVWLVGFIVFLFSEIGAVLVVRDQDFRKKLVDGKYMNEGQGEEYQKLAARENLKMAPRPYLSIIALLMMFIGTSCLMYPLCDILTIIGLPSAPCILLITVGSLLATVCNATFLLFLIWSCTRPWAALIFLLISLTGTILLPSGNPILLVLWLFVAIGGSWAYFFYLPTTFTAGEQPSYIQSIGDFTVEPSMEKIQNAFKDGYAAAKQDAEDKFAELEKAAKETQERVKAQAEKAAKMAEEAGQASAKAVSGDKAEAEKK